MINITGCCIDIRQVDITVYAVYSNSYVYFDSYNINMNTRKVSIYIILVEGCFVL